MNDWKFGDVIQRDAGRLVVMVCGGKSQEGWMFEDGYAIRNDPGWGIVLKNANHHHNYPVHKTCVIATGTDSWEKVE